MKDEKAKGLAQARTGQQSVSRQIQERRKRKQDFQKLLPKVPNAKVENGDSQKRKEKVQKDIQAPKLSTKPEELDTEIEEIARRIKETNDKKMVQIKNYPMFHHSQTAEINPTKETPSEDWTSVQGQFGWVELYNTMIPYLTRSGEKYVCLRMIEGKIFLKYKQLFSDEVWNCFHLEKLNITKAEASLLNEINIRHCDSFFGQSQFTTKDMIVSLNDVKDMHDFLEFCYIKAVDKDVSAHRKCGFIRIASQNCVPYVWYSNRQYVPLFYFEGECKYLEDRCIELRGWELAYLKVACKIQGIRKTLFDNDSIKAVEMDLVKKFFPPDTLFEWMWPIGCNVDSLMHKPLLRIVPVDTENKAPAPTVGQAQEKVNKKRMNNLEKDSPLIPKKTIQVKSTLQKVAAPNEMPFPSHPVPSKNYHNGLKPPPYVPTSKSHPQQPVCLNQYISSSTSIPSLSSSTTTSGLHSQYQVPSVVYVNKPTYPPASVASNVTAYKQTPTLRAVSTPNSTRSRVLQIPDFICNSVSGCPYFMVKSQLEDNQLNCINMEPYLTTILLVTLEEVATSFFKVPVAPVVNAVNVMRLDIFLPNKLQIRYLERSNKYPTVGLIKYKDFLDNTPQIRYILSSLQTVKM